jgi:hypothetical protein
VINIIDEETEDDMRGLDPKIVNLLTLPYKKHRIAILTEAEQARILNNSKTMKVDRLPALLLVKNDKIVNIVYLTTPDEFDIANNL